MDIQNHSQRALFDIQMNRKGKRKQSTWRGWRGEKNFLLSSEDIEAVCINIVTHVMAIYPSISPSTHLALGHMIGKHLLC